MTQDFNAKARRCKELQVILATLLLCAFALISRPVQAQGPTFKLSVGGAWVRMEPRLTSALGEPIFGDESYPIVARTHDGVWLKVALQDKKVSGWILSSLGAVAGDVSSLPAEATKPFKLPNTQLKLSAHISPITKSMKALWQNNVKAGRRADMFTVVGDCNSEPSAYVWRLSAGSFDVSRRPELKRATEQFMWAFTRDSSAAFSGFNTTSMFDPQWSNPRLCNTDEGLLVCEVRRSNASIAFVALGTGDQFVWQDFEKNYRRIVDYLLENKVVPVLVTKADDLEAQQGGATPGFINDTIRKLGAEYGVPVMDFHAATRTLPDFGMRWEGNENFHMSPEGSDLRIVLTLQTLTALTSK